MFSLNGTLKKSGSVGRWETKQFIGVAQANNKIFSFVLLFMFTPLNYACPVMAPTRFRQSLNLCFLCIVSRNSLEAKLY